MRARFREAILSMSVVLLSVLVGCGGGTPSEEEPDDDIQVKVTGKTEDKGLSLEAIRPGAGILSGRVTITNAGDLHLATLNAAMINTLNTAAANDRPHCVGDKVPKEQKEEQGWRLSDDEKGVKDVFIFLRPPSGKFFALEEKDPVVQAALAVPAILDQPHCAFVPHGLILFPSYRDPQYKQKPTGQKLVVQNSAQIGHNTKYGVSGGKSGEGNVTIGAGTKREIELRPSWEPVPVACTIHPWMNADIWVLDNPYYALTDKDGSYVIKNVPKGKFFIVAWHGKAKFVNQGGSSKGEEITLDETKDNKKDFTITAK